MHYEKEISQSINKLKAAWNVIKSLTNKQVDSNEEFILQRELISDPQILAESFNNYFIKVVEESVSNVTKHYYNQVNNGINFDYLVKEPTEPVHLMKEGNQ
jgi:GMP synthase PP-ATPase subunit